MNFDRWYLTKLRQIETYGEQRYDKLSRVQEYYSVDLSCEALPLLSLKPTPWKSAIREMLWFISPSSDYAELHNSGCRWWRPWLQQLTNQDLSQQTISTMHVTVRQLPYKSHAAAFVRISDALRAKDFDSTRLYCSLWPTESDLAEAVLVPCALAYQLHIAGSKVHMTVTQRSADLICGVSSNVIQYAWLLSLYAKIAGLEPGVMEFSFGDLHVYKSHVAQEEWAEINSFARRQEATRLSANSTASAFDFGVFNVHSPGLDQFAEISLVGSYEHCGRLDFPVVPVHTPQYSQDNQT